MKKRLGLAHFYKKNQFCYNSYWSIVWWVGISSFSIWKHSYTFLKWKLTTKVHLIQYFYGCVECLLFYFGPTPASFFVYVLLFMYSEHWQN